MKYIWESPAVSMNKSTTTRRFHSTDFFRLKNITFGITLPKEWTQKIGQCTFLCIRKQSMDMGGL